MTVATLDTFKVGELADKYLRIYNADIDWEIYIKQLAGRLKTASPNTFVEEMQKRISCTIMLPYYEKTVIQDPAQNLLFYCHKWSQYNDRDWVNEFRSVYVKDQAIEKIRAKCLDLGVIYPLEYNPNTRQAFNWLYEEAEASGAFDNDKKDLIIKKLQNLVYAYGGVVVCSVFSKPEFKTRIANFPNWRSGYFFERLIHDVYKEDEILKIKTHELNKILNSQDKQLVKKIKTKE